MNLCFLNWMLKFSVGKLDRLEQKYPWNKRENATPWWWHTQIAGILRKPPKKPSPLRMSYEETVHKYSFSLTNSPTSTGFLISEK